MELIAHNVFLKIVIKKNKGIKRNEHMDRVIHTICHSSDPDSVVNVYQMLTSLQPQLHSAHNKPHLHL